MRVKDAVGKFGEQTAAGHLERAGLTILARNWRCRQGELDIIATEGSTLVVVEVKTRSSGAYGSPAEAVNHRKAMKLRQLAALWLAEQRDSVDAGQGVGAGPVWPVIRFDVVAVQRRQSGRHLTVEHLRGVLG